MFVAAHLLLRRGLSAYENVPLQDWEFAADVHGKPVLSGRHREVPLHFNLAHTRGLVACAICRSADVGIDVESLDSAVEPLDVATRYFSPSEIASLQQCDERTLAGRFIELWTLKEAYIKAVGTGFSHPLSSFGFHLLGHSGLQFDCHSVGEQSAYQFALFTPSPRHRMAVAVACVRNERFTVMAWPDESAVFAELLPDRTSR